jgi:DNA ligase-1
MKLNLLLTNIDLWIQRRDPGLLENYVCLESAGQKISFDYELNVLNDALTAEGPIYLHRQKRLPINVEDARQAVEDELQAVLDRGGEGVILRNPDSPWLPKRVPTLLKYKPFDDDEGILVGFTSGRKTDKGSKFLGRIGALILDYNGKRLELSGMAHELREFATEAAVKTAKKFPGANMPAWVCAKHFQIGQEITFKYRELSDDGIPKEARFWRKR